MVNPDSASHTYYITDDQATPIPVIGTSTNPITILAGERDSYEFPAGAKFNSGIKLSGIECQPELLHFRDSVSYG